MQYLSGLIPPVRDAYGAALSASGKGSVTAPAAAVGVLPLLGELEGAIVAGFFFGY